MPTDIFAIAEAERKLLFERDAAVLARIRNLYGATVAEINKEISLVAGQLQALQKGEGDVRREPGLIAREIKAKSWLRSVESRLNQLAAPAAGFVAWHQTESAKLGEESVIRAGNRQLGHVATEWNKLQTEAMEAFAGFAGDGSPLKKIFKGIAPQTAAEMEAALFKGIGLGKNPLQTARELRQAASLSSLRAQTIARTETIRAYRETQHLSLNENTDVLEGWVWTASKSMRSCASCLAMDGTFHKTSERMNSHPNCRCVAVPLTKGIDEVTGRSGLGETRVELGETGTEWFNKQDAATQNFVLGPKGGVEFRKGNVKLENFVDKIKDPEWGDYFTRGSLKDALKGGGAHPGFAIPPVVKKRKRAPKGLPPTNVLEPPVVVPTPPPAPVPAGPIPGQFKNIADAESGMETLYPNIKFDFQSMHIDTINPTMEKFHKLAQEWPEVHRRLKYVGGYKNESKVTAAGVFTPFQQLVNKKKRRFSTGEMAHAAQSGQRMGLNPTYFKDPVRFRDEIARCEASGWFAPGAKGPDYILTHEFGHLVDFWMRGTVQNRQFYNTITGPRVSKYSKYNEFEAFAETFASLHYTSIDQRHAHATIMEDVLNKVKMQIRGPVQPFQPIANPYNPNP